MTARKRDNSAAAFKVELRNTAMQETLDPLILETHGGEGLMFTHCYAKAKRPGWVCEKDGNKCSELVRQRPDWHVFECESEALLEGCPTAFKGVNFVDIDPWGNPWEHMQALFVPERRLADRLQLVVHDGCRRFLAISKGGGRDQRWRQGFFLMLSQRYGTNLRDDYLEICQVSVAELAKKCGYRMAGWAGQYTGHDSHSTHYWATLLR
ncbi:MAG TPA: hypothetical protein V6D07_19140 [Trichocoleus sp.]